MKRLNFKSPNDLGWKMSVTYADGFGKIESNLRDLFVDCRQSDQSYYNDIASINAIESMTLALVCTGRVDDLEEVISHAIESAVEAMVNH